MNNLQLVIDCLEVRKRTISKSLDARDENRQDFSDWSSYSEDDLKGRYSEIKNTLDMLYNYCR